MTCPCMCDYEIISNENGTIEVICPECKRGYTITLHKYSEIEERRLEEIHDD